MINSIRDFLRQESAGGILLVIVLMAVLAPVIAPHDPYEQDLFKRLLPPFWMEGSDPAHLLGTDNLGRDYLSRLIYGAQISLLIGVCTALLSGIIGSALGTISTAFLIHKGWA